MSRSVTVDKVKASAHLSATVGAITSEPASTHLPVGRAAELLGTSADTVRRLVDRGEVAGGRDDRDRRYVDGADLARYLAAHAGAPEPPPAVARSARNRFTGLVTRVVVDGLVAQVELQAGPHRVVSLLTAEAASELGLVPGMVASASVKATSVVVEVPAPGA